MVCCFFFSSRRRHTRSDRDWSSDVCSSDLPRRDALGAEVEAVVTRKGRDRFAEQNADEDERELIEAIDAPALNPVVDDPADHERVRQAGDDAERDTQAARQVQPALDPHKPENAADLPAQRSIAHAHDHRATGATAADNGNPSARSRASMTASSRSNLQPGSIGSSHLLCQCHAKAPSYNSSLAGLRLNGSNAGSACHSVLKNDDGNTVIA